MYDQSAFMDYNPVRLSIEEKRKLQQTMKSCFEVLSETASKIYGFANIKKLRDEYHRNGGSFLKDYPEAVRAAESMKACEVKIISGYIGVARKLCLSIVKAKENNTSVSFADLIQESALAIYDAMYHYKGNTKFVTYVTWCIRNRLLDCTRRNQKINGFSAAVIKLRKKVRALMGKGLSVDAAINQIQDTEGRIDPHVLERLRVSLSVPMVTPKVEPVASFETETSAQTEAMRRAIDCTPLSTMEKNLIEAHLRGDNEYRRNVSEKVVNPKTGKLWTKQRLSQIFLTACEKVRATYECQTKQSAAA